MEDYSRMKTGRKAIKWDSRTLRVDRYFTPALPPPPASVDWTKGAQYFGEMLNDTLENCTIAGCGHAVQIWLANAYDTPICPVESAIPDAVILAAYEQWDGYNPADPSTDQGGIELDVLNDWRKNGLGGHKLLAFADPKAANLVEVRQSIALFGGVYIGVSLPLTAQSQDVWDVVPDDGSGSSAPGSWGGHAVFVPAYDASGFTCITWGAPKKMTTAFWNAYVDEAHALLSPDWFNAKGSPDGFDLAQLQTDLALIK